MSTVFERADQDIARGDYFSARQRLTSRLLSTGYDPRLLERLGELCVKMHDPGEAGKYYLLSSAAGADIEQAIDMFVQRCGGEPERIVSHLPQKLCLSELSHYHVVAQGRILRLNLEAELGKAAAKAMPASAHSPLFDRFMPYGCLLIVAMFLVSAVVGFWTILKWIRK